MSRPRTLTNPCAEMAVSKSLASERAGVLEAHRCGDITELRHRVQNIAGLQGSATPYRKDHDTPPRCAPGPMPPPVPRNSTTRARTASR
jgi:hypothetical protein